MLWVLLWVDTKRCVSWLAKEEGNVQEWTIDVAVREIVSQLLRWFDDRDGSERLR